MESTRISAAVVFIRGTPPGNWPSGKVPKSRYHGDVNEDERKNLAIKFFEDARRKQMVGEYAEAVELYKKSIDAYPTAEAYTFLGWTYSFMGRVDDAIAECHKAIE